LVFIFPVAAHILMYKMGYFVDKLPRGPIWSIIQIFFSGPALIMTGYPLYFKYGHIILNKIIGALLILIGIYWLYILISDIVGEAA
jgi:hypothetical protein